ncbi:MAG TPA: hypothetical protein VFH71_06085 [Rhodanobacteraceae bacterium]|nr:hypothetical protein [Rhodanobacteraceae bacterium]
MRNADPGRDLAAMDVCHRTLALAVAIVRESLAQKPAFGALR